MPRCANRKLREMIVSGAAKPSRIVSHRVSLDDAPRAFAKFDASEEGYNKVVLKLA
jgi:glutathione-independent formaldehyde dehydrogenase